MCEWIRKGAAWRCAMGLLVVLVLLAGCDTPGQLSRSSPADAQHPQRMAKP